MGAMLDPFQELTVVDYGDAPNDLLSTERTVHAVREMVRDVASVKHEDGILSDDAPPSPGEAELRNSTERFRGAGDDADRELLLRAFAAQESIDWPALDALVVS